MKKVIIATILTIIIFITEISAMPAGAADAIAHRKKLAYKIAKLTEFAADYGYDAAKSRKSKKDMQLELKELLKELTLFEFKVTETDD